MIVTVDNYIVLRQNDPSISSEFLQGYLLALDFMNKKYKLVDPTKPHLIKGNYAIQLEEGKGFLFQSSDHISIYDGNGVLHRMLHIESDRKGYSSFISNVFIGNYSTIIGAFSSLPLPEEFYDLNHVFSTLDMPDIEKSLGIKFTESK